MHATAKHWRNRTAVISARERLIFGVWDAPNGRTDAGRWVRSAAAAAAEQTAARRHRPDRAVRPVRPGRAARPAPLTAPRLTTGWRRPWPPGRGCSAG